MNENNLLNQSENKTANLTNNQLPKANNFLVTLLSILLLVSCLIAGFFAYQTQNLVKKLQDIQKNVAESPKPISSPVATNDPTQSWGIYENKKLNFSFKLAPIFTYPKDFSVSESNSFSNREDISSPLELTNDDILLESTVYTNIDQVSLKKVNLALESKVGDVVKQPFQPIGSIKKIELLKNGGSLFEVSPVNNNDPNYLIAIWVNEENVHVLKLFGFVGKLEEIEETFKQMVDTYNFSNLNQTACTMDAKACPDGTYVSRSGPNCEFPSCPKPLQ